MKESVFPFLTLSEMDISFQYWTRFRWLKAKYSTLQLLL